MADYVSPGAMFGHSFDNYLMQKAREEHQTLLDDLASKREQRLAQAELDSAAERKDELARKKTKDLEDAHDRKVKDFEKRVSGMVAGDRPDPEMIDQAKSLGMAGIFRQQAPVMNTTSMQPPAALTMSGTGPAEGTSTDEPAVVPGAMTPGPVVYPGSPKERQDADLQKRREAFIAKLPDDLRQEAQLAFEAESLGMKTPTGLLSKANTAPTKHRVIFDPVAKKYMDGLTGKPITDEADLENAQVDRAAEPTDHSAQDAAKDAKLQATREHAYTEFNQAAKPVEDQISNLNKLTTALNADTNIADSTLAEQIIKVTAGGANSGVRITLPEIEQVLKKSRTNWDSLQVKMHQWGLLSDDEKKQQQDLFYTPEQKQAMRDLVKDFRKRANATHQKIVSYRRQIDDAKSFDDVNRVRTRAQEDLFDEVVDTSATPNVGAGASPDIEYDVNGKPLKKKP